MKGNCVKTADGKFKYDGTVSKILDQVSLSPKVMVQSGEQDQDALDKLGGKVLGHIWEPVEDYLIFRLHVNLFEKQKGQKSIRTGPDLTVDTLGKVQDEVLTKRIRWDCYLLI